MSMQCKHARISQRPRLLWWEIDLIHDKWLMIQQQYQIKWGDEKERLLTLVARQNYSSLRSINLLFCVALMIRLKSHYGNFVAAQFAFCGNKGKSAVHSRARTHSFSFRTCRCSACKPECSPSGRALLGISAPSRFSLQRQFVSLRSTLSQINPCSLCLNSWLSQLVPSSGCSPDTHNTFTFAF